MNLEELLALLAERSSKSTDIGKGADGASILFKRSTLALDEGETLEQHQKAVENEKEGFSIPFVISDSGVDRDDDIVMAKGGNLENFLAAKAPVLFAHNQRDLPIANAPDTKRVGNRIKSTANFPSADLYERGNTIGRLVLNGFLGAASIGFLPTQFERAADRGDWAFDFKAWDLLEWSVVPVPANPRALAGAKSMGIELRSIIEWCEETLDGEGHLIVPRHRIEEARKAANGDKLVISKGGWELTEKGQEAADADPVVEAIAEEPAVEADVDEPVEVEGKEPSENISAALLSAIKGLSDRVDALGAELESLKSAPAEEQAEPAEEQGKDATPGGEEPEPASESESGEEADGLSTEEVERMVDEMLEEHEAAKQLQHQRSTGALPTF